MQKKNVFIICILLLILSLLSIFIQGYQFNVWDSANYVPLVKYYYNIDLYPNSPYIKSQIATTSVFYYFLSKISFIFGIELTFLVMHFILRFLLALSIFCLAYYMFKNKFIAYLSVILCIFIQHIGLASATITATFFGGQWYTVIPLLFFSLYFFIKEKYYFSIFFLIISAYIHLLATGYLLAMYLFYFIFQHKKIIKSIIISFFIFIFAIAPLLIKISSIFNNKEFFDGWINLAKITASGHIFPLSWPILDYLIFFVFVMLFIISFKFRLRRSIHKKIVLFSLAVLVMCIISFIFIEIITLPFAINLAFFRSTIFLVILGKIYIANYLTISFIDYKKQDIKNKLVLYGSCLFLLLLIIGPMFVGNVKGIFQKIELPNNKVTEWEDIGYWIKENTNLNSTFITPLFKVGFMGYSERNNVIDSKNAGAGIHDPEYGMIAWSRMKDMCNSTLDINDYDKFIKTCTEDFNSFKEDNFIKLSKKYNVDYLLLEKPKKLNFTKIYENKEFILYKIK